MYSGSGFRTTTPRVQIRDFERSVHHWTVNINPRTSSSSSRLSTSSSQEHPSSSQKTSLELALWFTIFDLPGPKLLPLVRNRLHHRKKMSILIKLLRHWRASTMSYSARSRRLFATPEGRARALTRHRKCHDGEVVTRKGPPCHVTLAIDLQVRINQIR